MTRRNFGLVGPPVIGSVSLRSAARLFPAKHYRPDDPPNHGSTTVGLSASRFTNGKSLGVLYAAESVETALHEALIRDSITNPEYSITLHELDNQYLAFLDSSPLRLLMLDRMSARKARIHRDVVNASDHHLSQEFSDYVYRTRPDVDGFSYHSTMTDGRCFALFDRSLSQLSFRTGYLSSRSREVRAELESCYIPLRP